MKESEVSDEKKTITSHLPNEFPEYFSDFHVISRIFTSEKVGLKEV
jgi:hypothetical protein